MNVFAFIVGMFGAIHGRSTHHFSMDEVEFSVDERIEMIRNKYLRWATYVAVFLALFLIIVLGLSVFYLYLNPQVS